MQATGYLKRMQPCLFCGSRKLCEATTSDGFTIHCYDCEAFGPVKSTVALAKRIWNRAAKGKAVDHG